MSIIACINIVYFTLLIISLILQEKCTRKHEKMGLIILLFTVQFIFNLRVLGIEDSNKTLIGKFSYSVGANIIAIIATTISIICYKNNKKNK